ncbi:MAG: hypothetical protein ACYTAU_13495 [Planctomycetota bacterium]|jgi:hypothetical protein
MGRALVEASAGPRPPAGKGLCHHQRGHEHARHSSFTIIGPLAVVSFVALLFGILLPAIGEPRDNTRINGSRSSLCPRGVAPKAHAADRAGRRLTLVHDAPGVCDGVEGRDTLGKE